MEVSNALFLLESISGARAYGIWSLVNSLLDFDTVPRYRTASIQDETITADSISTA